MSFTRFHDDPCRIKKQLQESTGPGRFILDVPGNGLRPCYMEDPYIRMQKWGANLQTNSINLESDLRGLSRNLNKDCLKENIYNMNTPKSYRIKYPTCAPITDQPRATDPAWTARDLCQVNWYILPLDPQENVCIPFENNLSTRILEKDFYKPEAPCLSDEKNMKLPSSQYTSNPGLTSNICNTTNSCESL